MYVEVKGTQTRGGEVIVTPNEVEFAQRNKINLFVLHSANVVLKRSAILRAAVKSTSLVHGVRELRNCDRLHSPAQSVGLQ